MSDKSCLQCTQDPFWLKTKEDQGNTAICIHNAGECPGCDGYVLKFTTDDGTPLAGIAYIMTGNGGMGHQTGITDDEGQTERVTGSRLNKETMIIKVSLQLPAAYCCATHDDNTDGHGRVEPGQRWADFTFEDIKAGEAPTTIKIDSNSNARDLTEGEIKMAMDMFRDAIDYSQVKVHKGTYWIVPPGVEGRAMTPNGEIYFPEKSYRDDFSAPEVEEPLKIMFIHEMTHVWQYQLGYFVKTNAAYMAVFKAGYWNNRAYYYDPIAEKGKAFSDFNMEQQGDLVSHFYWISYLTGKRKDGKTYTKYTESRQNKDFLWDVVWQLRQDPKNKKLLPNTTAIQDQ